MKRHLFLIISLITICVFLQSCASTGNPLEINELKPIKEIKVVCYKTPEFKRHSASTITGGGLLLGGFGMDIVAQDAGKKLRKRCSLPDYNHLVMLNFTNNIQKEIEDWPAMSIEKNIVENDYIPQTGCALCFKVDSLLLYTFGAAKGLTTAGEVKIISSDGEKIWFHRYLYQQKDYGKVPELEELEADNCKLLKVQLNFSAKQVSNELIKDIRAGLNQK